MDALPKSKLQTAVDDLWKSIGSDINWADGWDSTRSSLRNVIAEAKAEEWELIERVLKTKGVAGLCYANELGENQWSVWTEDGSPATEAKTPKEALLCMEKLKK